MKIDFNSRDPSISEQVKNSKLPYKTKELCIEIEKDLQDLSRLNIRGVLKCNVYKVIKKAVLAKANRIKLGG